MAKVNPNVNQNWVPQNPMQKARQDQANAQGAANAVNFGLRLAGAAAGGLTGTGPLLGGGIGGIGGIGGGGGGAIGDLQGLLQQQMQVQAQMQAFSMQSNIAKTDHDAKMTSIRNMRAS